MVIWSLLHIHNIHHDYLAFQFNVRFAHPYFSWLFMDEKGASQTPLCDSPLLNFRAFSPKPTLES